MYCKIEHQVPGRIRFNLGGKVRESDACAIENILCKHPLISKCTVYPKAGSLGVFYNAQENWQQAHEEVIALVKSLSLEEIKAWQPTDSWELAPRPHQLYTSIASMLVSHGLKMLIPEPFRTIIRFCNAIPFWREGLRSLRARKLDIAVLDAASIAMSFISGSNNAGSTMLLLKIGEALEDFTQRSSQASLARSLLDIPTKAYLLKDGEEKVAEITSLRDGDLIVARMGHSVPVDGVVVSGEAAINQSSLTGESLAVMRSAGDTVFAGTAVEAGEICIRVQGDPLQSKVHSIVKMVEQTEALKSTKQKHIESIAEGLVPWNFLLAGVVFATTRDLTKTASVLMVDYSCALKLSGSIAVMTAQKEGSKSGFMVRGSRYFDAMASANALVFDKTGTLTNASPVLTDIETYGSYSREEVLRLAACLEEHFPHPVARAVVNKAEEEHLEHREKHAKVEYIVAHGITSSLNGKRVVIGSEHFVTEDEHVTIEPEALDAIHERAKGGSPLFLAIDNKLQGVLYINDPIKPQANETIQALKNAGFTRVVMLTGDNQRAAAHIAKQAGIEEFYADLLPEDKRRIIRQLQHEGYEVAMVGDGVNDSPALSAANISIAMNDASAIARETADITLVANELDAILKLRNLSSTLQNRMQRGYKFTIGFNSALLALGIAGILTPTTSSLLHNGSTVALSVANTRPLLK